MTQGSFSLFVWNNRTPSLVESLVQPDQLELTANGLPSSTFLPRTAKRRPTASSASKISVPAPRSQRWISSASTRRRRQQRRLHGGLVVRILGRVAQHAGRGGVPGRGQIGRLDGQLRRRVDCF